MIYRSRLVVIPSSIRHRIEAEPDGRVCHLAGLADALDGLVHRQVLTISEPWSTSPWVTG